jgi:hypothetical protein
MERIRYSRNENKRKRNLKEIKKLVERVQRLCYPAPLTPPPPSVYAATKPESHSRTRGLVHNVYYALEDVWSCECQPLHSSVLCVNLNVSHKCFGDPSLSSLDINISSELDPEMQYWHDGCLFLGPDMWAALFILIEVIASNPGVAPRMTRPSRPP